MTPELIRKIRESTHSLIETCQREKTEAVIKASHVREDVAMLTRAQDFVRDLLADINHIGAILWNARYPQYALPDDLEIYRVPVTCDGRFQRGGHGFTPHRDSEGKAIHRSAGLEPGWCRWVFCDLFLSPDVEEYLPKDTPLHARFVEAFTSLRRQHPTNGDYAIRVFETPTGETKFWFYVYLTQGGRGLTWLGGVESLEDFTDAITTALNS